MRTKMNILYFKTICAWLWWSRAGRSNTRQFQDGRTAFSASMQRPRGTTWKAANCGRKMRQTNKPGKLSEGDVLQTMDFC